MESVIGYGLTVTVSALSERDLRQLDTRALNPALRQITGANSTTRRQVTFAIADIKSAHNHYLLKTANILDRALRGQGTRIQETIRKYLQDRKLWVEPPKLRTQELRSLTGGMFGQGSEQKNKRKQGNNSQEGETDATKSDWRWWILECSWANESRQKGEKGQSIFRAQANETNLDEGLNSLTFQYTNLHNWLDVAVQVLGSVGWNSSCVYEDTLFPPKCQYGAINRRADGAP